MTYQMKGLQMDLLLKYKIKEILKLQTSLELSINKIRMQI